MPLFAVTSIRLYESLSTAFQQSCRVSRRTFSTSTSRPFPVDSTSAISTFSDRPELPLLERIYLQQIAKPVFQQISHQNLQRQVELSLRLFELLPSIALKLIVEVSQLAEYWLRY